MIKSNSIYNFCDLSKTINKTTLNTLIDKLKHNKELTSQDKKLIQVIKQSCLGNNQDTTRLNKQEFAKNLGITRYINLLDIIIELS